MAIIKIDGKPLEKLIEVISIGIGKLYRPKEIRKIADAEAYKIEVIEKAIAKSKVNSLEIDFEYKQKIDSRIYHIEAKRQLNIENITYKVAEQLQNETHVSEENLDDDWISRFFDTVQDISNDDMQILWSRILYGEIKRPKSFSLRTLEFLKNLSQDDAKLLKKISKFCLSASNDNNFILYNPCHQLYTDKWDFTYREFLYLTELGILSPHEASYIIADKVMGSEIGFGHGNKAIIFKSEIDGLYFGINATPFTKLGNELLRLIEKEVTEDYLHEFIRIALKNKQNVTVTLGIEVGEDNGEKLYDNFQPFKL
ncbi:DUF2806 domain-containing protein [Flavobacterium pallidum]|uniref:DUF2806 domain-containing protein n=1 Tax=Flavobacterium pallidum TaxID=2172098 RepID=A0A2S1SKK1_9FLAO|nr:DUF2806 domain-containing protein [Flavobacterium pallidum]AWI26867.1 hypothetical protein HYN49_13680 [Flavobacterium pallidum]